MKREHLDWRKGLLAGFVLLVVVVATAMPAGAADILMADNNHSIDETRLSTFGGHTVVAVFDGDSDADWATALAGGFGDFDLIIIAEDTEAASTLSAGTLSDIADYVSAGGCVIVSGNHNNEDETLNAIFGFSTTNVNDDDTASLQGSASGTAFDGGPATLVDLSAVEALTGAPGVVYYAQATSGAAWVFVAEFGAGVVGYHGWDFNEAGSSGDQDDWYDVLDRIIAQKAVVPFLPTRWLIAFGLLVALLGTLALRRRTSLA